MKVSQLRHLVEGMNPDDELMVLFWEKPEIEDFDMTLTKEGWAQIVKEFEEWDGADRDICEWLGDAVIEHSTEVGIEPNNG